MTNIMGRSIVEIKEAFKLLVAAEEMGLQINEQKIKFIKQETPEKEWGKTSTLMNTILKW